MILCDLVALEGAAPRLQKIDFPVNTRSIDRDHHVNRYCGGSHTVTTPQQRVMRMGHYLSQWGPEVVQLTEGMVKGTDGRMYRSRQMLGKFDVCGPAYCEVSAEEAAASVIHLFPVYFVVCFL